MPCLGSVGLLYVHARRVTPSPDPDMPKFKGTFTIEYYQVGQKAGPGKE